MFGRRGADGIDRGADLRFKDQSSSSAKSFVVGCTQEYLSVVLPLIVVLCRRSVGLRYCGMTVMPPVLLILCVWRGCGVGKFHELGGWVVWLNDSVHPVVVLRGGARLRVLTRIGGCDSISFLPLFLTPGGSGIGVELVAFDRKFQDVWFFCFCRVQWGAASVSLFLGALGHFLSDGRPLVGMFVWLRFFRRLRSLESGRVGFLMPHIAVVSKAAGSATPLGQRLCSVLLVVYRNGASGGLLGASGVY